MAIIQTKDRTAFIPNTAKMSKHELTARAVITTGVVSHLADNVKAKKAIELSQWGIAYLLFCLSAMGSNFLPTPIGKALRKMNSKARLEWLTYDVAPALGMVWKDMKAQERAAFIAAAPVALWLCGQPMLVRDSKGRQYHHKQFGKKPAQDTGFFSPKGAAYIWQALLPKDSQDDSGMDIRIVYFNEAYGLATDYVDATSKPTTSNFCRQIMEVHKTAKACKGDIPADVVPHLHTVGTLFLAMHGEVTKALAEHDKAKGKAKAPDADIVASVDLANVPTEEEENSKARIVKIAALAAKRGVEINTKSGKAIKKNGKRKAA